MKSRASLWFLVPIVGIVILDECLKYWALQRLPQEGSLSNPGLLDFAIHKNPGIAFDIPLKMPIIVLLSILIGVFLVRLAVKEAKTHPSLTLAASMIIFGAAGNLYDRLVYGFTVDYIILFGRSAINLSDLVVLTGVIGLFFLGRSKKRRNPTHDA